ncbi:MAG: hypothetical protein QXI60_06000 [Thermofilaceae archaeon]
MYRLTQVVFKIFLLIGICAGISTKSLQSQVMPESKQRNSEAAIYESRRIYCNLKMARARQIGLKKDRSQAQFLIEILTNPPCIIESADTVFGFAAPRSFHIEVAALTALARLGDAQTLPQILSLGEKGWNAIPFYRANLARLQVETRYPITPNLERLHEKVQMYYQVLGISKTRLAEYLRLEAEKETPLAPPKLERIAVRHLTEIVANAHLEGVPNAFQLLEGLDYMLDPPSALRVQLAQIPVNSRVEWLIRRITQRKVFDVYADYELQALIDCGAEAIKPIMSALRSGQTVARRMLLEALCAIEFQQGCPSIRQLAESEDPLLAQQAETLLKFPVVVRASDW